MQTIMKALLATIAFWSIGFTLHAQTAAEPKSNPPTLRQALVAFGWSWVPSMPTKDPNNGGLRFYKDGVVTNPRYFIGRWEVTGLQTVTLQSNGTKRKAFLTFDSTFTKFEGIDFNGKNRVEGARKSPVDPEATLPATHK